MGLCVHIPIEACYRLLVTILKAAVDDRLPSSPCVGVRLPDKFAAVDRQLLKVAGSADAFGPPKTQASVRTVRFPTSC